MYKGALRNVLKKGVQHPDQAQHPPNSSITSQASPAQYHVQVKMCAGHQRHEQNEHGSERIPYCLQDDNLAQDLQGREFDQCARSWGAAASCHELYIMEGMRVL